ncbi:MAG: hypothetical protein ACXWPM_10450, partial [Bdellovibrionota bacterium]
QAWAQELINDPGIGHNLKSFATAPLPNILAGAPGVNIVASWIAVGDTTTWQNAVNTVHSTPGKEFYMYNGKRPASGSFATEDDGVSMRELPWGQFKKGVARWFTWESAYYNDNQAGRGEQDVWNQAHTFGGGGVIDPVKGETGWNYSNGEGVLFYPGTDVVFPASNLGVNGPVASLRLKHWRRGVQDVDYLTLAYAIDPVSTQAIINQMVPSVLWEPGITDPTDPTWVRAGISWSTNPDDWEAARAQLAHIIDGQ